jgi:hypothetical protein
MKEVDVLHRSSEITLRNGRCGHRAIILVGARCARRLYSIYFIKYFMQIAVNLGISKKLVSKRVIIHSFLGVYWGASSKKSPSIMRAWIHT